jgi:Flp pilus assembly protein TadG
MKRNRKTQHPRRGATAVEFAVVAPAFLFVCFFSIEFARMTMIRNLAQTAAYEGSRLAMMEGATNVDGEARAKEILNRLGTKSATVSTTFESSFKPDGTVAEPKAFVKTTVSIPLRDNTWVFPGLIFGDGGMYAETRLRSERYRGFYQAE